MSFRCENNHLLVSPGECEICLLRARVEAFKAKLAEARSGGCFCDRSHPELADSHLDTCPKFLLKLDARRAALTKKLAARLAEVEREASYHSHHSIEKGNCLTCAQWMDTESSLAKARAQAFEEAAWLAEKEGVVPPTTIGMRIANTLRAKAAALRASQERPKCRRRDCAGCEVCLAKPKCGECGGKKKRLVFSDGSNYSGRTHLEPCLSCSTAKEGK